MQITHRVYNPPPLPQAFSGPTTSASDDNNNIYLKLGKFHPQYIPSRTCQQIHEEELSTILHDAIGIEKMIVCYKRAKDIGDVVSQTSLFQNRGEEVSTYLGGQLTKQSSPSFPSPCSAAYCTSTAATLA